jgi:hypothetical protein
MVSGVMGKVASLAPSPEIFWRAVFRLVIEVGDGEHDAASGDGVKFAVSGSAVGISRAAFAAMSGAFEDVLTDFPPVFRVARPVFDGHCAASDILFSVMSLPSLTS